MWLFGDVLGLLIISLSAMSKLSAHTATGDYGWYWGDFFFLKTGGRKVLSFDGVFDLFPHPMYTLGYGWTYGCALLARSSMVLCCTMLFHTSQLLFLTFVETPHVEQLYLDNSHKDVSGRIGLAQDTGVRKGEERGCLGGCREFIRARWPRLQLPSYDVFNGYDVNMTLMNLFFILGISVGSVSGGPLDSNLFFLLNFLVWRGFSFFYEAYVLVRQEKYRFWTRSFQARGLSKQEAFAAWKRLMTCFSSLQTIAFLLATIRVSTFPPTWKEVFHPHYISQLLGSFFLLSISLWSKLSCYEVLGEYGWFYGDFFLSPSELYKRPYQPLSSHLLKRQRQGVKKRMMLGGTRKGGKDDDDDDGEEEEEMVVEAPRKQKGKNRSKEEYKREKKGQGRMRPQVGQQSGALHPEGTEQIMSDTDSDGISEGIRRHRKRSFARKIMGNVYGPRPFF